MPDQPGDTAASTRNERAQPLSTLAIGEHGVVQSVSGDADDPISRRLIDLGFLAGTDVLALRRAPLGEPTVYQLRGYQMCLRRREADRIIVTNRESASTGPQ